MCLLPRRTALPGTEALLGTPLSFPFPPQPASVPLPTLLGAETLAEGTEGKGPVSPQRGLGVPLGGGRTQKRPQRTWRHTLGCSGPPLHGA